jgi:hypothetical protein
MTNVVRVHLYKASRVVQLIKTKTRMMVTRDWGEKKDGLLLLGGYSV